MFICVETPIANYDWSAHFGIPEEFVEQHMNDVMVEAIIATGVNFWQDRDSDEPSIETLNAFENPRAIDPRGCGCTECLTGEYVPEERALPEHWLRVLQGTICNNTSSSRLQLRNQARHVLYGI